MKMKKRQLGCSLILVVWIGCAVMLASTEYPGNNQQSEQTGFNSDEVPGQVYVKKPVRIPDGALAVLRDTLSRGTANCIQDTEGLTPEQVPASWFVGSEIHLDGPEEVDLVVLPARMTSESPSPNRCLYSAHGGPFWLLRNINRKYELLLETYADGLGILDSRTNFYRDIQTWSTTVRTTTTLLYKMDVGQYQLAEKKTEP
jgi:hypothetical protein